LHVSSGLDFVSVHFFMFNILSVLYISFDHCIPVLLIFVVLGLVSSVPSRDIGWEERL